VARVPEDLKAVWRELCERFATRERSDLKRSAAVAELLGGEGCMVRRLLAYFGEELGRDCGHCGRCDGEGAVSLKRGEDGESYAVPMEALAELRARYPDALGVGRQVARFLCGIASPALTKAKLTRHALFGSAGRIPFAKVAAAVDAAR
jgi:ATP-dependent DNA helicase RecQ